MSNPFNTTPNVQPNLDLNAIRNVYKMLSSGKNPMQLFESLASNNPSLRPILNAIKGGTNPQTIFESMCKERGIDPQEFLKSIQDK